MKTVLTWVKVTLTSLANSELTTQFHVDINQSNRL